MNTDAYGLPDSILGIHPDAFYGSVGRIVCVAAVLEDQVTTLRHTLAGLEQGKASQQPLIKQIEAARKAAIELPGHRRGAINLFLDDVVQAFARRNAVVHSAFPAQGSGKLVGHRPTRDASTSDGRADWFIRDPEDFMDLIAQLSELVMRFNAVHSLVPRRSD